LEAEGLTEISVSGLSEVGEDRLLTNPIRRQGQRVAETLLKELSNPASWPRLKAKKITVKLSQYNRALLLLEQQQTGYKSLDPTLTWVLEKSRSQESRILPATSQLVWFGDSPVSITGPSGGYKTTFVKTSILSTATCPVLICDVAGEYDQVKRVSLSDIIGLQWDKADASTRLRFIPNPNPALSKVELDMLFGFLNTAKQEGFRPGVFPSGQLSKFCFILEEAHRLKRLESAASFVLEGRKFTKKVITVTSDASLFSTVCRLLRPQIPI
jgi:hypothetical protein